MRVVALSLLTTAIWCWHYDRLTWAKWSLPLDYSGDSLEILARIKAASEGDLVPFRSHFVHRLGAPFNANWNEYPGSDDLANYGLGWLARVIGVSATSNVALLLAHVTAALSFYLCARLLRHRWEWAFAGALLFAFSFFSLTRSLPHLWLTFTYTVPLALLTCWLIAAGRRTTMRPAWRWLCYGTAVALGASNPYNLFLYLQLLAWSILAQWLRSRWSANVRLGLACGVVAVFVFAAIHAHTWINVIDEGGVPLLVRNYAGTEIYGLKPIELFVPSSRHHSKWLAEIGYRYMRWSDWRGETFSPYLGFVGAAGLLWMMAALMKSLLAQRRRWRPAYSLPAMWILIFSTIGGVNSILAFYFGLNLFRASNRYSVFLLALALLFVVAQLSIRTRAWRPAVRLALAGLIAAVGLWDQLPARNSPEASQLIAGQVRADRRLGEELEKHLGPGAMVFQLPILDFPEGRPQLRVNEYDHFRPYFATRTLQFSYGESKGRARGTWQYDCTHMVPATLVRALEGYGFAALYINRQGYPDNGEKLLAELAAAGRAEVIGEPDQNQVVVRLHPVEQPQPPLAHAFTYGRGWNPRLPADFGFEPRRNMWPPGSFGSEPRWNPGPPGESGDEPHWTNGSASLSYYNPFPHPLQVSVHLVVSSMGERTLRILVNDREQTRLRLGAELKTIDLPAMELKSGVNRIDFVTPEPAIRVNEQRWRLRAIGVHRLQLRIISEPMVELADEPDDKLASNTPDSSNHPGSS
jgi:hypothetical protein